MTGIQLIRDDGIIFKTPFYIRIVIKEALIRKQISGSISKLIVNGNCFPTLTDLINKLDDKCGDTMYDIVVSYILQLYIFAHKLRALCNFLLLLSMRVFDHHRYSIVDNNVTADNGALI